MTTPKTDAKRILVVDDEPGNTRLLKLFLERTPDYVVREENDAKAAVATAENFLPDLILLDVMMPDIDGAELAGCFRASPTLAGVPVVFLTAAVTREEVQRGNGTIGGFPFLAKPIILSEVVACVEKHLADDAASRQPSELAAGRT